MTTTLTEREALLLAGADRARLAPSIHNTQPWTFHLREGALELHSDPARQLSAIDPGGRELLISCGAALLQLRLALAARGVHVGVTAFPDTGRPHVVARVWVMTIGDHDPIAAGLDAVMERRQTNRQPFHGPIPTDTVRALRVAAELEGAGLKVLDTPGDQAVVAVWQQFADAQQSADPAYRRELRAWVGAERAVDGIPVAATAAPGDHAREVAPRDFTRDAAAGAGTAAEDIRAPLLLLYTDADDRAEWLTAGQALARVWLEATRLGVAVQPLSQSLEVASARAHLRSDLGLMASSPQLLLRVGLAAPQARTPRRPLSDVLHIDGAA